MRRSVPFRERVVALSVAAPALVGLACLLGLSGYRCPILALTGVPCPGCGVTRGLLALLRLDFAGALGYNPLVFLLVGEAAAGGLFYLAGGWNGRILRWMLWVFVLSALGIWGVRVGL